MITIDSSVFSYRLMVTMLITIAKTKLLKKVTLQSRWLWLSWDQR